MKIVIVGAVAGDCHRSNTQPAPSVLYLRNKERACVTEPTQ